MKGIPKLQDIQSPVEGMQVWVEGKITTISPNEMNNGRVNCNGLWYGLRELKQIVVEYEPYPHAGISKKGTGPGVHNKFKQILPLHPDDWKYALEHLGEEMEFETDRSKPPTMAKLIHPTPIKVDSLAEIIKTPEQAKEFMDRLKALGTITYTEEEVKELCLGAANYPVMRGAEKWINDWWNEHKKK